LEFTAEVKKKSAGISNDRRLPESRGLDRAPKFRRFRLTGRLKNAKSRDRAYNTTDSPKNLVGRLPSRGDLCRF